ncbi:class E sortase [Streptomyces rectiverticillatus]|uniref:class E sortase n=1 Tax=Streptomyces rectiverticillatus TaxID=173860 RepID=UPI0015C34B3F|nr:class E sortase [Streptomyces rectiverticillatus]QLE72967.1 class E sortase [Streptomyces rectiverticillatus]
MELRLVVRTVSELCLTIGTLLVLFVVYVLYWTGVRADGAMDRELSRLQDRWSSGAAVTAGAPETPVPGEQPGGSAEQPGEPPDQPAASSAPSAPSAQPQPPSGSHLTPGPGAGQAAPARQQSAPARPGEAFAVMYIPRFGAGWAKPVLEGTGTGLLKKGLGHYERTARPGGTGNFAVAGHRRTYGDPFKDLDELRPGDAVVVGDGTTWFTYRVDGRPYRTRPDDTGVIDPVPAGSGFRGPGRYLTLTTCEPEWGHSHRLIVWARLDATSPAARGRPGALSG